MQLLIVWCTYYMMQSLIAWCTRSLYGALTDCMVHSQTVWCSHWLYGALTTILCSHWLYGAATDWCIDWLVRKLMHGLVWQLTDAITDCRMQWLTGAAADCMMLGLYGTVTDCAWYGDSIQWLFGAVTDAGIMTDCVALWLMVLHSKPVMQWLYETLFLSM